jgi:hypothetical protein
MCVCCKNSQKQFPGSILHLENISDEEEHENNFHSVKFNINASENNKTYASRFIFDCESSKQNMMNDYSFDFSKSQL